MHLQLIHASKSPYCSYLSIIHCLPPYLKRLSIASKEKKKTHYPTRGHEQMTIVFFSWPRDKIDLLLLFFLKKCLLLLLQKSYIYVPYSSLYLFILLILLIKWVGVHTTIPDPTIFGHHGGKVSSPILKPDPI